MNSLPLLRRLTALLLIAAAAGAFMAAAWAQALQPVPALTARVIDQTGTLTPDARQRLEDKLQDFEQREGTQIVVLMVPATAPEDIAAYANRVANAWKIGRRDVGDGLLVIVAKNERRMRIEVAKTLEGAVPDLAAARIIDQHMKPAFRNNDFAGGIDAALDQLIARIGNEATIEMEAVAPGDEASSGGLLDRLDFEDLLFLFFLPVVLIAGLLRKAVGGGLGVTFTAGLAGAVIWWITSSLFAGVLAGVAALIIASFALALSSGLRFSTTSSGGYRGGHGTGGWSSGSSSSGGWSSSSSSSSDSFSSGGGGDFGGGGASGDW
ncbi:TPM domain-containing protein [Xenophilus arseniciresistens]|uniref:TPM domain-containing protein n=1 Tax=Xenophilus arseniciresistens TaxID=1283306 RepID=A0AAE3NA39_9BURK|nr:TPM domain-containing protein [Xenophilus arseniciresistens]MDA7418875.1 TPM domain-containing protein [Xenophilus arseniciresistens]